MYSRNTRVKCCKHRIFCAGGLTASKQIFAEGDVGDQAYRIVEGSIEISIQGRAEADIDSASTHFLEATAAEVSAIGLTQCCYIPDTAVSHFQ
jgi:hypothetical protein